MDNLLLFCTIVLFVVSSAATIVILALCFIYIRRCLNSRRRQYRYPDVVTVSMKKTNPFAINNNDSVQEKKLMKNKVTFDERKMPKYNYKEKSLMMVKI